MARPTRCRTGESGGVAQRQMRRKTMRFEKQLGIRLLAAGLTFGMAGLAFAQDAAPPAAAGEQPKTEAKPDDAQAAPAAAQEQGRQRRAGANGGEFRRMDPARMLQRMRESFNDLNLSEEQKTKVQAVMDKAKPQLEALAKETESLEPRERATKMREAVQPIREEM